MPGARVRDDAGGPEVAHRRGGVGRREHHDG